MITIAVPPAGERGRYSAKARPAELGPGLSPSGDCQISPQLPPSPRSASSHRTTEASIAPSTARSATAPPPSSTDPFAHVIADLQNRVAEYRTSGLDALGQLRLFDLLSVRKGALMREFHVYLFQEALICITEEKKSAIRSIFSSASSARSSSSHASGHGRGELKLKGRIYLKHVKRIVDSSVPGELSLTIVMVDENMDSFILTFRDRGSHETWKRNLTNIVEEARDGGSVHRHDSSKKIAQMMGAGAPQARSASGPSKPFSPISTSSMHSAAALSFGDAMSPMRPHSSSYPPNSPQYAMREASPGDLAFNAPLAPVHTPVDLVIILSLPAPTAVPGQSTSSLPLKTRLMRSSLVFILALMGNCDRIALVACEMGVDGTVRKTPFLNTTKFESRRRLEAFVESLGTGHQDNDEFQFAVGRDEKMDVVTAVNVALDVVLQRKVKNPLGGMILISDTSDAIKRAQMDLVTARLDAANLPVHAVGYGKGHDPSPLWMISNHTSGTYTYVREWYHLRDTLAGVVGGMMSIAVTNMKLHLDCQDNQFKVLKVSGSNSAIVSQSGKDVDVELRELRFGETREILVELDLEVGSAPAGETEGRHSGDTSDSSHVSQHHRAASTSTSHRQSPSVNVDSRTLGLETLSVGDSDALRNVVYEDALIDEWPVTEIECSWHDPSAGRSVARLAHPVLLTVAILPPNAPPSSTPPDATVVRRRMEVLASDMITRALLIASRKNYGHATRILSETKRIVETVTENMRGQVPAGCDRGRTRRETQLMNAVEGLDAVMGDLEMLVDGLEEHKEMFERDYRNFAAQQVSTSRDTHLPFSVFQPRSSLRC